MANTPVPVPFAPGNGPRNAVELALAQGKDIAAPDPALATSQNATRLRTGDDSVLPSNNQQQPTTSQPKTEEYWKKFRIKPQPNVLDAYSSYSYSASVYLMTEAQYLQLLQSANKNVAGMQLLFQSGGAQANFTGSVSATVNGETSTTGVNDGLNRSRFFTDDFYIDSITLENNIQGKATGAAHLAFNMSFTVIEPTGITLIDRLAQAVADFRSPELQGKPVNYAAAQYLMVIRFYGYDKDGKQVQVTGGTVDQEGVSQQGAIVERFIPFKIKGIKFSVGNTLVTYTWECVPVGQLKANYVGRGTIPADIELASKSVGDILGGTVGDVSSVPAAGTATQPGASNTTNINTPAPQQEGRSANGTAATTGAANPNTTAAPTNVLTANRGLVKALNDTQQQLVKQGIFDQADVYDIRFIGDDAGELYGARLELLDKDIVKKRTASAKANPSTINPDRGYVDLKTRSYPVVAGTSIVQVIDLMIRNSTYISNQSLVIYDEKGNAQPNKNRSNAPLKWFTIAMHAEPLKWDNKRNDYAYRIVYSISSRLVKNVVSRYFVSPAFTGVAKRYPYWFTGQNTAVLEYKEDLNTLYQFTVSGGRTELGQEIESQRDVSLANATFNLLDIASYTYFPRSLENSAGGNGPQLEAAANLAEQLYSPYDLREVRIKILGDPAWIAQGSVVRAPNNQMFSGTSLAEGFLPDGTIAFENQDVLFEIAWQKPVDYDTATGVADPYRNDPTRNRNPFQSRIYLAKRVISEFTKGSFYQTLEGAAYYIPTDLLKATVAVGELTPSASGGGGFINGGYGSIGTGTASVQRENAAQNAVNNTAAVQGGTYNNGAVSQPAVSNNAVPTTTAAAPTPGGLDLRPAPPPKPATDGTNNSVASNASNVPKGPPPNLGALQANVARLEAEEAALQKEYGSARGGREFLTGEALANWEQRSLANDRALGRARLDLRQAQQMARES